MPYGLPMEIKRSNKEIKDKNKNKSYRGKL